ncbi:mitogen-activated protein kinase kinase kinase 20 [Striga hermonthica]|uniref:Mitogen-activated protein kinase kinase kinase 20 n=1 Tax=Striga hermonthica TaxID=68872 RepID=A0A9N7RE22_STRHE|nr:mitogen-activated protein kinase kinase kinase 20 [Striga hermonthica]
MGWVRGETLGKGGFGFVSMAKTNQDHNLPPLIAVKSSKVSESESLKKEKELLNKFQSCPSILRCFGDEITTENGALGCSVLHMLTGKQPWTFDSKAQPKDVLFKIGCSDQIPKIPTNNRTISKEAKDFLTKCLVKDPTARWKPDMLLDHPFVKKADPPTHAGKYSHHHHHHHHRLSHGIHSLVPHCFHHPKVQAC